MKKTWEEVTQEIKDLETLEIQKIIDNCLHNNVKRTHRTAKIKDGTLKIISYHCQDCQFKFERDGQLYPDDWKELTK